MKGATSVGTGRDVSKREMTGRPSAYSLTEPIGEIPIPVDISRLDLEGVERRIGELQADMEQHYGWAEYDGGLRTKKRFLIPGHDNEVERLQRELEQLSSARREILSTRHVDLTDLLVDDKLDLTKREGRPARAVLEEYLARHNIGSAGADIIEDLLGLIPSKLKPESAQAAILTTRSSDGTENTPFLVYKLPYHHGGDFPVDAVYAINISGNLGKPGTKAYVTVLRMSRKRHHGRIMTEPALSVTTYGISHDSNCAAHEGHLHTTNYDPRNAHTSYRAKRAVATYEKIARFLDTLVKDPRAALALLKENGVTHSDKGFTITTESTVFNRATNEEVTDKAEHFFPYDSRDGSPSPNLYEMMTRHAGNNGYSPVGKHAIIAALRQLEQEHTKS
jgi:hypothetical protein